MYLVSLTMTKYHILGHQGIDQISYLVSLTMTKYHIPPPTRCRLPEGWSPGPTKRVIRPDDALLTSLLDFSEGEEVVFFCLLVLNPFAPNCHNVLLQGEETESGSDEEEAALGRRRLWQKQCELYIISGRYQKQCELIILGNLSFTF